MNRRYMLIGAGIGAGVLVIMFVLYFLRPDPKEPGSARVPDDLSSFGQAQNTNTSQSGNKPAPYGSAAASPPPWTVSDGKPAVPADQANLLSIQARLAALTAGGKQPDPRALDALLAELERTQHATVVGGANIEALRENLAKATEIGDLAKEMEQAAKQPKPDMQKIQGLMDQIQKLQAGIRTDLMAVPAGAKP